MANLLALDQSSRITGWAVFKDKELEAYGKFEFDSDIPIEKRLNKIKNKVLELIGKYEIDEVILEDIQMQNNVVNNVQTFKVLAEVFGVLSEMCVALDIPQSAVLASTWKSYLGIKGKARAEQKRNAQTWVVQTYGKKPTQDECDAICIGMYGVKNSTSSGFDWS